MWINRKRYRQKDGKIDRFKDKRKESIRYIKIQKERGMIDRKSERLVENKLDQM